MMLDVDDQSLTRLTVRYQRLPSDEIVAEIISILTRHGDLLQAARWIAKQCDPTTLPSALIQNLREKFSTPYVMVSEDPTFVYPFWQNLGADGGSSTLSKFTFEPGAVLPFRSGTRDIVVISGVLDRLAETEQLRLLRESGRVVKRTGALLCMSNSIGETELSTLAEQCGLTIISMDRALIEERFAFVPRLKRQQAFRTLVFASHNPGNEYDRPRE